MTIFDLKPQFFYHPIKVLFLDDNQAFLNVLELEFSNIINMEVLTNPDIALQMINTIHNDVNQIFLTSIKNINSDTTTDKIIGFEINKILSCIYDKNRFEKISVLVVDYEMPNINGIEFCQKLENKNVFRIMLTAEADKDTAIRAFNYGIIDKFILKTSKNLYNEITDAIFELTNRYFNNISQTVLNYYGDSFKSLFEDESYQLLFNKVRNESKAVEFYLVDNSGSFLFLNKEGKPTWLILKNAKEIDDQIDLLKGYDVPDEVILSIQNKENLLFLLSENDYKKPVSEWMQRIFKSNKLNENYYYSIVEDKLTDFIRWDEVVPYNKVLFSENIN